MNALVLLLACLMFAGALSIMVWTRKRIEFLEKNLRSSTAPDQVADELTALNAGTIGMGGRFLKLERDLQALSTRLDDIQTQIQSNTPYGHAIVLAQKGISVEEIVELCGISLNEAQLLMMMHQRKQAA